MRVRDKEAEKECERERERVGVCVCMRKRVNERAGVSEWNGVQKHVNKSKKGMFCLCRLQ